MATANFNLRARKSKEYSIVVVVRLYDYTIRYSTKLSINPADWDAKKQRPKKGKNNLLHSKLDKYAQNIRESLLQIELGDFSPGRVKEQLAEIFGHIEPKTNSLFDYAETYCQGRRKELRFTVNSLKRFLKGRDLFFIDVDAKFVASYVDHLKGKNLEASSINSHLTDINQIMRASFRDKMHANSFLIDRTDKIKREASKQVPISLTPSELRSIASIKLDESEARTRDLFLIGVYTGQRFSDYSTITPDMIRNGEIYFTQKKTGVRVRVPVALCDVWGLPSTLSELLQKYGNSSPKVGYTMFRNNLRSIAAKCIDSTVEQISYKGGKRSKQIVLKAERTTSHVARKTFCTLLHKSGLSDSTICTYSGHKSEMMLRKYIGITEKEKQRIAREDAQENMKSLNELENNIRSLQRPSKSSAV